LTSAARLIAGSVPLFSLLNLMIPAAEALERLREGNARFVADVPSHATIASRSHRGDLADGQEPFAIILGCSDSRVPAEIVFDQDSATCS
jgi:carbonic anhydrase